MRRVILTLVFVGAALATFWLATAQPVPAAEPVAAKVEGPDGAAAIAKLDWLAGRWLGDFNGGKWEVCYTTPAGGEILGVNKEIRADKVAMIEFERFHVVEGRAVVTPYPFGRMSPVGFALADHDADARRAVFANPDHDFPQRITYHCAADDRLVIVATGQRGEQAVELKIDLRRVD